MRGRVGADLAPAIQIVLILLLQACVSTAPVTQMGPLAQSFVLKGRVSVKHEEENFSGSFDWTADIGRDELLFSSPLGQGVVSLTRSSRGVTLTPAGQPSIHAETADELTEKALGFRLPLAGLRYWVQGLPDPSRPFESAASDNGGITQLRQDGWVIDYLQYRENRPRKIQVTRDGLEIRLVIDEWQAH